MQAAQRTILFECYIVADDALGREFAAHPHRARACRREGVPWSSTGSARWSSLRMWDDLRAAGGDVRVFNPPRLSSPLGWLSRDHRKTIVVDGTVGFVSGLCVSEQWLGDPARKLEPWRDTGIEVRGPAVGALEARSRRSSRSAASRCPMRCSRADERSPRAGDVRMHVIANEPNVAGTFRMDLIVASIAREPPVAHRRVFRRHDAVRAGVARRRARRRRRAPARARRERHPRAVAAVARAVSSAARGRRARVRMERHDAAREDRRRRRPLGARRLDQPQSRELDVELRARRRHRGRGVRRSCMAEQYEQRPRARDGDRAHVAQSRAARGTRRAGGRPARRAGTRGARCRAARAARPRVR